MGSKDKGPAQKDTQKRNLREEYKKDPKAFKKIWYR